MSVPRRPGAPLSASRPDARATPRRSPAARASAPRQPASRPGGPGGRARNAPKGVPRIDGAGARGSAIGALSWRTAVLVAVAVLAIAVLMPSLRVYFQQQDDLRALRSDAEAARVQVDDLHADVTRWGDAKFVIAQARERLAYVFPGETPYRVVDPGLADPTPAPASITRVEAPREAAWYERLWSSIQVAGEVAAEPAS